MEDFTKVSGRIFDIQRYSVHDGKGIRTIVFLKGCVLRCKWCCNPESQSYAVEKMRTAVGEKTVGRDVTAGEVMETVVKDRGYYRRTGGGLTLSGGECLLQPEFSRALLALAKDEGLTTAIESMACVPWETIESVLPYLDTYLMDIKHIDPEKHKRFTGKENVLMMENAKKVARSGQTELVIRVPVVPTFNATEEEIEGIAAFADSLPGVKRMHLLPYHRLGQDKYDGLNRPYDLRGILPPDAETMEKLLAAARRRFRGEVVLGG